MPKLVPRRRLLSAVPSALGDTAELAIRALGNGNGVRVSNVLGNAVSGVLGYAAGQVRTALAAEQHPQSSFPVGAFLWTRNIVGQPPAHFRDLLQDHVGEVVKTVGHHFYVITSFNPNAYDPYDAINALDSTVLPLMSHDARQAPLVEINDMDFDIGPGGIISLDNRANRLLLLDTMYSLARRIGEKETALRINGKPVAMILEAFKLRGASVPDVLAECSHNFYLCLDLIDRNIVQSDAQLRRVEDIDGYVFGIGLENRFQNRAQLTEAYQRVKGAYGSHRLAPTFDPALPDSIQSALDVREFGQHFLLFRYGGRDIHELYENGPMRKQIQGYILWGLKHNK